MAASDEIAVAEKLAGGVSAAIHLCMRRDGISQAATAFVEMVVPWRGREPARHRTDDFY